jgi:hypothetical protein
VANLDACLRRLEEAVLRQEVDREMERWEPLYQALGFPNTMRPFLRQWREEFIRWQRDNAPVTEELLEKKARGPPEGRGDSGRIRCRRRRGLRRGGADRPDRRGVRRCLT